MKEIINSRSVSGTKFCYFHVDNNNLFLLRKILTFDLEM